MLDRIRAKVMSDERLTPEEGLYLLQRTALLDMAPLAHMVLPMIGQGDVVLDGAETP